MTKGDESVQPILESLIERAKELNCLYTVDEILSRPNAQIQDVLKDLVEALPPGWQYSDVCIGMVSLEGEVCSPSTFHRCEWSQSADIVVLGEHVGEIVVCYTEERPNADEGPFLAEERKLIDAIAERIGLFVMHRQLQSGRQRWESTVRNATSSDAPPWTVLLEFLRRTDSDLLTRITRKMINHLCWNGIEEAEPLLQKSFVHDNTSDVEALEENRPLRKVLLADSSDLTSITFEIAGRNLSENEVISCIQEWINEEKSTFLIKSLESPGTGLAEMAEAIERYSAAGIEDSDLPYAIQTSLRVALLRRFFVDQLDFISVAKDYTQVKNFYELAQHLVYPLQSQGKLGGKGAGLFLATRILESSDINSNLFRNVKVPKTWYVASDTPLKFIHYNSLDEVYNQKYMEIARVRQDYPHIIQVFKNSRFPPEIVKGLSTALDDFGDCPIIVRSSSLLEDRAGSAFSGKYKSLFLANQGTKEERLEALQDAIAEVYASVFGPDPIEYRAERGLLDYREEMGILIQEVVGQRIGKYFFPAYAGVAFSNNEFRWSPRINREDGLVRMVPGLGTRAVDRMSDDYPVLLAPGQPGLRANTSMEEIVRYSPKWIDVINIETNAFETVDVHDLMRTYGDDYPAIRSMISIVDHDRTRLPTALEPDWNKDAFTITFEGLFTKSNFVNQIHTILSLLRNKMNMPVDIEFASNGEYLYILQCRVQSHSKEHAPAAIPRDIPRDRLLFSANRHISNGSTRDITHIVYVDPERYAEVSDIQDLKDVGRAVGKINKLLPKRQFILMGPGRWGSRGDIKLGVNVTYSDINNTAVLIEIARKKGEYVPELSFGTHFFQDLVEAGIRYLPLYPDESGIAFNELFLRRSGNIMPSLVPEYAHLSEVVRVIDVSRQTNGRVLRILMNADIEEAVGILTESVAEVESFEEPPWAADTTLEQNWRWRLQMAEKIADTIDVNRFGVKNMYIFGSTKNATTGPASDIDLIIHDHGDVRQRRMLSTWLDGWSLSLAEINYLRTGYKSDGLLDVHYVTDEDIEKKTSYAVKIGAVTDAARPLSMNIGEE